MSRIISKERLLNFLSQFQEEIELEELIEFIDLKSVSGKNE